MLYLYFLCEGIGWGMVTISALVSVYYNVIIMYAIYYMFVSFVNLDGEVPWIDCDNPWNTPNCRKEPYPDFPNLDNNTKVDELLSKYTDCKELQKCPLPRFAQWGKHILYL